MTSTFKPFQRVVTGHTEDGKSTVLFNDQPLATPMRAGYKTLSSRIWVTQESPADNSDQKSDKKDIVPDRLNTISTNGSHAISIELAPGTKAITHRTSSIDYNILISGQVTILLEDGSEETISEPGSVIVQRGTLHNWENRGDTWTKFVSVVIDAKPVSFVDAEGKTKTLTEGFQ